LVKNLHSLFHISWYLGVGNDASVGNSVVISAVETDRWLPRAKSSLSMLYTSFAATMGRNYVQSLHAIVMGPPHLIYQNMGSTDLGTGGLFMDRFDTSDLHAQPYPKNRGHIRVVPS